MDHCSYPVPSNDAARRAVLAELDLIARRDDPFFSHVTALTRQIFGTPIAFVGLIHDEVQDFLALDGADQRQSPRRASMCAFTVAVKRTIVLPDTLADPRFRHHPAVTEAPHLRFSASAPVVLASGFCLGTVCAVDVVPHDPPSDAQVAALESVAAMIARFVEVPKEPDAAQAARLAAVAERAQAEFLALIGHELRTPLNGITGLAQCLDPDDPATGDIAEAIGASAGHLDAIVGAILSFTELGSGDVQLQDETVGLDEVLDSVAQTALPQAKAAGKRLGFPPPTGIAVLADRARLELALTCLVTNVLIHGGTDCSLTVAPDADGHLAIAVTDNGPGIAAGRTQAALSAFAVGEDVHQRRADGLGLGLPLARRIAELHGGNLALGMDGPGLTATLTLPAWRLAVANADDRAA
ncbi:GAF protein [Oceaniovalibus guishaninsula JLT2003]|uniref:histidine kinase n=1 Tax=Oceaniovalibus guishaninsula JLT2003 TaxID=1231392 RepID=K2I5M3_9RHOB|nr:GAF domain-containing sensor histidine kinase [Oceaniovalibus guishaninsula]EKE44220.1 GAF protein [Oceaniovalibus guishaninsula JLT2003]